MLRRRVLAAYDTCAICGRPVDKTLKSPHPMSAEVDELIPVSRGGDPLSFNNCSSRTGGATGSKATKRMRTPAPSGRHRRSARATSIPFESSDW